MTDLAIAALIGALATAVIAVLAWSVNTVRRADLVVKADKTLRQTIADQATCIATLEDKVRLLTDKLDQAMTTIGEQAGKIKALEAAVIDGAVARHRFDGASIPEKRLRQP